jgi:deazaflavin-dependent oxidoreductase (nitroreductase family)
MAATTRPIARVLNLTSRLPRLQRRGSQYHARVYARTRGRRGGRWFGVPVMVIETVGRRSGKRRTTPIVYVRTDTGYLVTPANAGAERTPAWWLNLRAAGEAVAVIRGERLRVRPRVLEGPEHEGAWAAMARVLPAIDDYRTFTEREFPLVMLEPVS